MGADVQRERAARRHADFHALGLVAGALAMHRQADAPAQPAPLAFGAALCEARPVREAQRLVQYLLELTAVIHVAALRVIRKGRGPDEIAPAHLHEIDAHLARRLV